MRVVSKDKSLFLGSASLAVLAITLPQAAYGQTATATAPAQAEAPASAPDVIEEETQELVVVGARQAEQSAIQRKRTARTAQDSIVADDVGQFPDKNAAEAIARIAGVALDIDDSGQQGGFTIRGQSADLVRVEVDGMTSLPTTAADGRTASIGDISSDLIKSVDVIKGQTADMTPGGVGGTVRIVQNNGLDFAKPLYRLNLQGRNDTLSGKWSPRINAVATQKFFDGRLGLLFNGTYEEIKSATDYARVSDKQAGYLPLGDYDNSPEKSFVTPFDPLAAAVTSKAGCAALPTTGINSRLNCYAQWEDFFPSLPRPGRQFRSEKRLSLQVRADWRATDDLTLFLSYNPNLRKLSSQDYNLSVASPAGTTDANGNRASSNVQNVAVNENHYVTSYDMVRGTGAGFVSSLNWTSQVRDIQRDIQQHYAQAGADWNLGRWFVEARAQYSLAKSTREDRAFSLVAPLQSASFKLVEDNGFWTFAPPSSVDIFKQEAYYPIVGANGVSTSQQFEYTPQADKNTEWNFQLDVTREFDDSWWLKRFKAGGQYRNRYNVAYRQSGFNVLPGVTLSRAQTLDMVQYCVPTPTTTCQYGSARRSFAAGTTEQLYKTHTLTEAQYKEMIAASLMALPGQDFFQGYPGRGDMIRSWGVYDMDKLVGVLDKYADLSAWNLDCLYECIASDGQTYQRPSYNTTELTASAYAMVDFGTRVFGMQLDGNFGVRYQRIKVNAQPVIDFNKRSYVQGTTAGGTPTYLVTNTFLERTVGNVQRTSEDWLPSLNLALWPIDQQLGLRYSIALQRARPSMGELTGSGTVTCGLVSDADRTALEGILATNPGAVADDDPTTGDGDESSALLSEFTSRCTGRIGNPELKGYGATTQNLSLEWYPNRDTQLSVALYTIDVRSGRPEGVPIGEYALEGNTYQVNSYADGPSGLKTRGFEITGRTAFTFLPSFLKYTGGGFNYSMSKTNEKNTAVDPFTDIALPPRGQSSYYYNVNLWYDDGRLNARVAYQARDTYYDRTEAAGINRVPSSSGINGASATSYFKTTTPIFKGRNEGLDARASYNITKGLQLFVEAKNLTNNSIPKYTPDKYRMVNDTGTPYLLDELYAGRTYYAGVIATF